MSVCSIFADSLQHLVGVVALAWAWAPLQEHVGGESQGVGPHRVEDHSLEAMAVPVEEQFLQELLKGKDKRKMLD